MTKTKKQTPPKSSDTAPNASSPYSPKTSSNLPAPDAATKPTEAPSKGECPEGGTTQPSKLEQQHPPQAEQLNPEQRIAKLEGNLERLGTLTMQILQYIDKLPKQGPAITAAATAGANPAAVPTGILAQIPPGVIEQGIKMIAGFMTPAPEQRDPFELEIYKGMRESYIEGFKNYITTVNQNAQIGAQVLEALKSGKLKFEPPEAKTA